MSRVALVADDLTGATDTAVQFARHGWPTLVALAPGGDDVRVRGLVATSTDSRAIDPEAAADATVDAVRRLVAGGADRLYLKVDSTMRGSVAAQVDGALTAWSEQHPDAVVVCCPAYPAMGRTVDSNSVYAGGRLLEDGPAGNDPVTPVRTSDLGVLLPESVRVDAPTSGDTGALVDALETAARRSRLVTVDAVADEDLERLASAIDALGDRVVVAGSAGLAGALATRWRPDPRAAAPTGPTSSGFATPTGPVLVLVTSLHDVARDQLRHLLDARDDLLLVAPSLADLREDAVGAVTATGLDTPEVVVVVAPMPESGHGGEGAHVAGALADLTAALHRRFGARAVVVTGGDGARALADLWGAAGIQIDGTVVEGVPHGVLVGGAAAGLTIITKAGGFGDSGTLVLAVRAAQRLTAPLPQDRKDTK